MIDVLLATYRPVRTLLDKQINSIRNQTGVDVRLIVREDERGEGAIANFSALLAQSSSEYVALSDQDDLWCAHKLKTLMDRMVLLESHFGKGVPLLVFCDSVLTDAEMNPLALSFMQKLRVDPLKGTRFPRLLMQNFIAGHAMLFNAALREKAGRIPQGVVMHDYYLALVASAYGKISYVNEPMVFYRQHGSNVLGAAKASKSGGEFRSRLQANVQQARAFVERFGESAPQSAKALATLHSFGWFKRRFVIVRHGLWKQGLKRNLALLALA